MSVPDYLYNLALFVVMLGGLVSILYTLPKVAEWWRPLYWLAIPLALLPMLIVAVLVLEEATHINLFPNSWLLPMLKLTLFILGLQLIAVPAIHRQEAKEFKHLEALRVPSLPDTPGIDEDGDAYE